MCKKEKGVTLITLVVTIAILMIIAGVAINSGIQGIKKAKVESLRTNMLFLQAKGKEYVENANFNLGIGEKSDEEKAQIKSENLKGTPIDKSEIDSKITLNDKQEPYQLSAEDMSNMGIHELEDSADQYIFIYDIEDESVDVMYKNGITNGNQTFYTLSSIEDAGI